MEIKRTSLEYACHSDLTQQWCAYTSYLREGDGEKWPLKLPRSSRNLSLASQHRLAMSRMTEPSASQSGEETVPDEDDEARRCRNVCGWVVKEEQARSNWQ